MNYMANLNSVNETNLKLFELYADFASKTNGKITFSSNNSQYKSKLPNIKNG